MRRCSFDGVTGRLPTRVNGFLRDVDGRSLHMPTLCSESLVLVCTFKCVPCPICPEQLRRVLCEPLGSFFREAGVRFMVLCPGPLEHLRASRDVLKPFFGDQDVPFICDEDLEIASGINALLGPGQIIPCFFELRPDLRVGWTQVGRGPGNFGEGKVQRFVTLQLAGAQDEAESSFQDLSRQLSHVPALLEKELRRPSRPQGLLPPGMLEGCFQTLCPAERSRAARTCREWWLGQASLARVEAERCLAEMRMVQEAGATGPPSLEKDGRAGTEPWASCSLPVLRSAAARMRLRRRLLPQLRAEESPARASQPAPPPTAATPDAKPPPPPLAAPLAAAAAGVALVAGLAKWCRGTA